MDITLYALIAFLHVLAFAYWLGADLGVYYGANMLVRPGLSFDERMRILHVLGIVDMAPRTALIMMVPLGFTLARNYGSPVDGLPLIGIWVVGLIWLYVAWQVHLKSGSPIGNTLKKWDLRWRYLVLAIFLGLGAYWLVAPAAPVPRWLGLKVFVFGLIIANGLWLRVTAKDWPQALGMLKAGENIEEAEQILATSRKGSARAAHSIWFLVALMAFLGVVQPF